METAKQVIVEWSGELRTVVDRLKELGPHIRPTLICNLEGKPFTESGFRSNWHRLMQKALGSKKNADGSVTVYFGPEAPGAAPDAGSNERGRQAV